MKKRILTGWTIQRACLLVFGTLVLVAGIAASEWTGSAIGVFLFAMGLFGYSRGAGNCYGGTCTPYGSRGDSGCCSMAKESAAPVEEAASPNA